MNFKESHLKGNYGALFGCKEPTVGLWKHWNNSANTCSKPRVKAALEIILAVTSSTATIERSIYDRKKIVNAMDDLQRKSHE